MSLCQEPEEEQQEEQQWPPAPRLSPGSGSGRARPPRSGGVCADGSGCD